MHQSVDKTLLRLKTAIMPPITSAADLIQMQQQSNNLEASVPNGLIPPVLITSASSTVSGQPTL